MPEPFFFGVPLIAPSAARDWGRVGALLAATLRSILAQDDPSFHVLIAGHALPPAARGLAADARVRFLAADWPEAPPTAANDDGGRKKALLSAAVRAAGGGLLMFCDADDLVDRGLVAAARRAIGPDHVGGYVAAGWAIDHGTSHAVSLPHPAVSPARFHEACGSSIVARFAPEPASALAFDPFHVLGWHNHWVENAARLSLPLAPLPVQGGYLVGTGESHSELHGPHAAWKQAFTRAVVEHGQPLGAAPAEQLSWRYVPAFSERALEPA